MAELPLVPPDLVGRERELVRLRELLRVHSTVAIVGQPGVGKTVMAGFAARQLRDEFPDGCFAIDLRGVDEQPLPVRVVFERLLRALGVPERGIPANEAEQAGVYRAVLAGRRVLVVLDNAADEAQVRPFLMTAPGCRTLVTCRGLLVGLEAVSWLQVGPLEDLDAVALLGSIVGDRVREAPGEAAKLAALCGNLPLALRIAGNRLASRPRWTLAYLIGQLRDERTRLVSLSAGDLQVRSAFEMSYRRLSPGGRMVFRRLAAVPGEDFGIELVRVAAEMSERDALAYLDELVDASMVVVSQVKCRFRFHDLIGLFARERWEDEDAEAERGRVTEAVLRHLLSTAGEAGVHWFPSAVGSEVFASLEEALAWLEQENSNWVAAVREAARRAWHREVLDLAKGMHWYADHHWFAAPWKEIYLLGVQAAGALGDKRSEAQVLNSVGWSVMKEGTSIEYHEQALRVAIEAGDTLEQAWSLSYLGTAHALLGDADVAKKILRESVELATRLDFWDVQMSVRQRYGTMLLRLGYAEEALIVLQDLLAEVETHRAAQITQPRKGKVAYVIEGIGQCLHAMGKCEDAVTMLARARRVHDENGSKMLEALMALWVGRCLIDTGDHEQAAVVLEHALASEELSRSVHYTQVKAELARLPGK
ncbi:ATP-binding protein [Lentzea flava]|uniref:ATP-binding protein n=1 Tax=Lentzea flava TaxID=103732 RepID=UPI001E591048|nr:tetratricopeptide repeat protein [Lentzea flava]